MNIEQQIIYKDKLFQTLGTEQEFIIHPSAFGLMPLNKNALQLPFQCEFYLEDYQLTLRNLQVCDEESLIACSYEDKPEYEGIKVMYSGAVLIGADLVKEYYIKDKLACFSYQKVYELVFDNGRLTTTIDQSKAMLKIRKNIDTGLRTLSKGRDLRCIKRFLNSSLIGDYNAFFLPFRRMKYLKVMQEDYQ